jgi:hypothetical protein
MSKIAISGASTGTATFTIESPATSTNRTLTLPDNTGTIITQNSTPAFASTIGVGGATPAASGAGITFPATQSASSDANTLDDYEEGTFTPAYTGTSGAFNYSQQFGKYVKVGSLVYFSIYLRGNKDTMSGTVSITGLPFTSAASSNTSGGAFKTYASNFLTDMPNFSLYIDNDATLINMYKNATNANGNGLTDADFTNTVSANYLLASGVYQAA